MGGMTKTRAGRLMEGTSFSALIEPARTISIL